ncbi:MAG TPA: FxLYD domain-containing protein [Candidatus Eisenbacteria bacterium]|nr:FxLYD domain-containing protein [Candidatus Eisenbacteria bacterium]
MKRLTLVVLGGVLMLGGTSASPAADLKDKVKVETSTVGLHPGMDPGLYICSKNHLHIKGTVQNMADIPLGKIQVSGKAFGADGELLGTATFSPKLAALAPGEKAEINLEFLTVTGELIEKVKKHELAVVEALPKR